MAEKEVIQDGKDTVVKWTLTTADSDGDIIALPSNRDVSWHVFGTFGGGGVNLQGSNEADLNSGHTFITAKSRAAGAALVITASTSIAQEGSYHWYRPQIVGSTGATVTVYMKASRNG